MGRPREVGGVPVGREVGPVLCEVESGGVRLEETALPSSILISPKLIISDPVQDF